MTSLSREASRAVWNWVWKLVISLTSLWEVTNSASDKALLRSWELRRYRDSQAEPNSEARSRGPWEATGGGGVFSEETTTDSVKPLGSWGAWVRPLSYLAWSSLAFRGWKLATMRLKSGTRDFFWVPSAVNNPLSLVENMLSSTGPGLNLANPVTFGRGLLEARVSISSCCRVRLVTKKARTGSRLAKKSSGAPPSSPANNLPLFVGGLSRSPLRLPMGTGGRGSDFC